MLYRAVSWFTFLLTQVKSVSAAQDLSIVWKGFLWLASCVYLKDTLNIKLIIVGWFFLLLFVVFFKYTNIIVFGGETSCSCITSSKDSLSVHVGVRENEVKRCQRGGSVWEALVVWKSKKWDPMGSRLPVKQYREVTEAEGLLYI